MKETSRELHKNIQRVVLIQELERVGRMALKSCMLSVFVLFCLAMWGCEAQEDAPLVISDPVQTGSEESPDEDDVPVRKHASILKIVAFGDSLTAGFGVSPDQSYPAQLERRLQEQGYRYEVINAGVSGETSAGGVRRVDWILKIQPAIIILELGANDGLRGLPLEQTYNNLHTIIDRFQEEGVTVVLAGMRIPVNYGKEYTEEFFKMYVQLAQEFSVPLIPFFLEGVAAQPEFNQGDGIHPTAEGYTIVTQNVWQTLQPILQEMGNHTKET